MKANLNDVAILANGNLNNESDKSVIVSGVSKDTRTLDEGNLYIPIIGSRFDGHDFILDAEEKGASASLWQKDHDLPRTDLPLILVDNVLKAFHDMARNYRDKLDIPVIAITGSNGKTTTKDILNSILSTKYKTHATKGNENNEIGLPLTILSASEDTEILIIELGTESPGEINILSKIAKPQVAIITNIGDSHLDKLKTKENVAREKLTILNGLKKGGVFIYNKDDEYLRKELEDTRLNFKTLSFGQSKDAKYIISDLDITPKRTRFTVNGAVYEVPSPGKHIAYNATVSVIVSQLFDIDQINLARGLSQVKFNSMRNELIDLDGFDIIDDAYKSNPQNLIAALDTMKYYSGYDRKIAVLGDMLDLGEGIDEIHKDVISKIDPEEIDYLLLYGDHMKNGYQAGLENFSEENIYHFTSKEDLVKQLKDLIIENTLIIIKGSRTMKMEDITEEIKNYNI